MPPPGRSITKLVPKDKPTPFPVVKPGGPGDPSNELFQCRGYWHYPATKHEPASFRAATGVWKLVRLDKAPLPERFDIDSWLEDQFFGKYMFEAEGIPEDCQLFPEDTAKEYLKKGDSMACNLSLFSVNVNTSKKSGDPLANGLTMVPRPGPGCKNAVDWLNEILKLQIIRILQMILIESECSMLLYLIGTSFHKHFNATTAHGVTDVYLSLKSVLIPIIVRVVIGLSVTLFRTQYWHRRVLPQIGSGSQQLQIGRIQAERKKSQPNLVRSGPGTWIQTSKFICTFGLVLIGYREIRLGQVGFLESIGLSTGY